MFLQFKNKRNMKRTFSGYLLSFLLLIFIMTTFILGISYEITKNSLTDEIVISQTTLLEDKNTSLNNLMKDIIDAGYLISFDSSVVMYSTKPENKFLYNDIHSLIETIDESNSQIVAIELFFENSGQFIHSDGALNIQNTSLRNSWLDKIRNSESNTKLTTPEIYSNIDNKEIPVISYLQKIAISNSGAMGYLAIHIKEETIYDSVKSFNINALEGDAKLESFIVNTDGVIISHRNKTSLLDTYGYQNFHLITQSDFNNGYITTNSSYNHRIINYIKTPSAPWIIITETPYVLIQNRTKPLLSGILLTGLLSLLLSIIIAYFLTLRLYSPIKRLLAKASSINAVKDDTQVAKNELSAVSSLIDHLATEQKALQKEIHNNHPILVERLIKDIVTHKITEEESIHRQLNHLNINLTHSNYCIFIFEVMDYETITKSWNLQDLNTLFFAMKNIITEIIAVNDQGISADFEKGQVVALVNFDDYVDTEDYLHSLATTCRNTIIDLLSVHTSIGIGGTYPQITNSYLSYLEAKDVLHYKMLFDSDILYYHSYNNENIKNYFNPIKEIKILEECLRTNQESTIHTTLDDIFTLLKNKNQLSYENTYKVINKILDTLQWTLNDLGYSPNIIWGKDFRMYDLLSQKKSLTEIKEWIVDLYTIASSYVLSQKDTGDSHIDKIKSFINSHYQEDIYLDLIAEKVGLNTSYMSRAFKKETTQTVLEYINDIRIGQSKELLLKTKEPVKDIALAVGFNNIHSFNRRFKSDVGITPGQYRKSH